MFLFTALFRLILLPFTLFISLLGLLGVSSRILLLPLRIFARNTVACLVIAAAVILYFALKNDPRPLNDMKAAPAESRKGNQPKGLPPVVEPVTKYEDGDSVFSADLYPLMTEMERAQYSNIFYAVMRKIPDGREHIWSYYNIHGTLKPTATFKNKKGHTCRSFTEVLKVHTIQQTISGTACDNGGGQWCKLKPNATPACGLGYNPGFMQGIGDSIKNLF
jgi:hypothetical protein